MKVLVGLCLLIGVINCKPLDFGDDDEECLGYASCHPIDLDKINVHVVPHSHDDVGWLKTREQYFYDAVETIISSAIGGLLQNEKRRFIQVETAYFKLWWKEQTNTTKTFVRQLLREGRLEIIGGAWSMGDEATAHYQSVIDGFTTAFRYLEDNLGKCSRPKIGWQIDPFGHSREHASLFAQMGFDGFYFSRLDYRDRDKRKADKTMDLLWTGSANLGSGSNIFTSSLYDHYNAPDDFCFDIRCDAKFIVPDKESPEYNLDERVSKFADLVKQVAEWYPTNNILLTFGGDNKWESAERYYNNLDKLMAGIEELNPKAGDKEINIIYSTPSCYAKAVNDYVKAKNVTLEVKTDDFLPYADSPNKVWSGFYSSRASSKRYERLGNNLLQAVRQLSVFGRLPQGLNTKLEEILGIMQHHDALTGTEKQAVEKDYHRSISIGIENTIKVGNDALTNILGLQNNIDLKHCPLANISICPESEKNEFNVFLYNPLARSVSHYIQVPVTGSSWTVTDPEGNEVEVAITEPLRKYDYVIKDIGGNLHENILIFKADLPALGYNIYNIKKNNSKTKPEKKEKLKLEEDTKIGFDDKYVILDGDSGLVKSITINGVTMNVKQRFMYYKAAEQSGAYIFRPDQNDRNAKEFSDHVENTVLTNSGNVVREIKQVWNSWASQIIRIYKDEDFIEFDFISGPIDVGDNVGKEMILRYTTDLKTDGVFYTDSNGRELIYRKKNWRPTYNYTSEEPQANNYYPVNTRIVIRDDNNEFAVLNDRSQGGSSLNDGEVELMVNRGLLHDDGKGVGENLYEIEYDQGLVIRGSHFVTLGPKSNGDGKRSMAAIERDIAQRKHLAPWLFFVSSADTPKSKSFLNKELPPNVHLLTLDSWNGDASAVLLRLEHILEKDDDEKLSENVTVDLTNLFSNLNITSLKETLLAGNTPLSEASRLEWPQIKKSPAGILNIEERVLRDDSDLTITLAPMQIRTFIATVEKK